MQGQRDRKQGEFLVGIGEATQAKHRFQVGDRVSARPYSSKYSSCIWGCRMAVEMIVDHWNPQHKRYRYETFCYGPKSCRLCKVRPICKAPGRKGIVREEQDWVDADAKPTGGWTSRLFSTLLFQEQLL